MSSRNDHCHYSKLNSNESLFHRKCEKYFCHQFNFMNSIKGQAIKVFPEALKLAKDDIE